MSVGEFVVGIIQSMGSGVSFDLILHDSVVDLLAFRRGVRKVFKYDLCLACCHIKFPYHVFAVFIFHRLSVSHKAECYLFRTDAVAVIIIVPDLFRLK